MDHRRFDDLTRLLASGASRRAVAKGTVAGVLAGVLGWAWPGRGLAQQSVPLGGQCSAFGANAECSQAGTPAGGVAVICSDNGIARDGAFNCCRNAGGVCTADFHCCGAALCVNGVCGGGGVSGLPLGSSCTSTSQCSQSGGSVVCADNGLLRDGSLNCCRNQGGACTDPAQCCAALDCVGGVCGGGSSAGGTLAIGAQCTAASQCSQAGGAVVCADNGVATDGALNCCRNAGGACANSAGCCGGLNCVDGTCQGATSGGGLALGAACTSASQCSQAGGAVLCADNGYTDDGALNCCRNAGGACSDATFSADCCFGLYCRNGVCTDLAATGNLPLGSPCSASNQCDQSGGATVCADNGIAADGALNCCRNAGGACFTQAACCGGLTCTGGVCTGAGSTPGGTTPGGTTPGTGTVALGGQCTAASQCSQAGGAVVCADNGVATDGALNCCRNAGGACTAANNSSSCCGGLLCVNGTCQ